MWCNVHGHRHPRLDAALAAQAAKVAHTTNLGLSNPTTVEFARRLVEIAPPGLEKVFFSSDGSSAIEAALKMAFQYWLQADPPQPARTRFVAIGEAYHGDTLGAIGVGGVDRFTAMFAPLTFEALRLPSPGGPCPHTGRPAPALDESLAALDRILTDHASSVAAIIMEPIVQAAAGIYVHPPGFLRGVADLARRHDVLLILDEVATGFGRTGTMFACEQEGVSPDFLCLAKGLTAGYLPMAATLTTDEVYSQFLGKYEDFKTFFHGHSYTGNPLGAAAGLASLDLLRSPESEQQRRVLEAAFASNLEALWSCPAVGDVRRVGLVAGIELVRDWRTRKPYALAERAGIRVCEAMRRRGVLTRPIGSVVVLIPPYCTTVKQLGGMVDALRDSIGEVLGEAK
jgi:adenosylmethionine-8-amino-7-oxononanoate aminotransferase